jgi:hypothetical protein
MQGTRGIVTCAPDRVTRVTRSGCRIGWTGGPAFGCGCQVSCLEGNLSRLRCAMLMTVFFFEPKRLAISLADSPSFQSFSALTILSSVQK